MPGSDWLRRDYPEIAKRYDALDSARDEIPVVVLVWGPREGAEDDKRSTIIHKLELANSHNLVYTSEGFPTDLDHLDLSFIQEERDQALMSDLVLILFTSDRPNSAETEFTLFSTEDQIRQKMRLMHPKDHCKGISDFSGLICCERMDYLSARDKREYAAAELDTCDSLVGWALQHLREVRNAKFLA